MLINLGKQKVLGAIANEWARIGGGIHGQELLLNAGQFYREVSRERIRASRRAIPFCVLTIQLVGTKQLRRQRRLLVRFLHSNLRVTDRKAAFGSNRFAALLVDTQEMGGRCVYDRIMQHAAKLDLQIEIDLKVHQPSGFDPDSDDDNPPSGDRRESDKVQPQSEWMRIDDADVQVTNEDPMVPKPIVKMGIKRAVDIAGSSFGLIAGGPLILGAMAFVKLTSPGPALFAQTREGRGGKPFTIYKLRTMVVDAEEQQAELRSASHRDGPAFKVDKDPRVTPIGKLLRSTCVDELPQLWNVLKGDMSLVGPRPLPWHESRECAAWHRRRLDVRPGMTCYWQVNKDQAKTFDEWMRMDLRYVDGFGLFRDLALILKTFIVPLTGQGSK